MFEDIHPMISAPKNLTRISVSECANFKRQYPQVPDDYILFLEKIGHGDLGNLIIYERPMKCTEVYGKAVNKELNSILLFGDDTQGYCYGFDLKASGRVVEIDPKGNIDRTIDPNFSGFLQSFLV